MAHSDFSWRKIFSIIGAGLLLFVAFVAISSGALLLSLGNIFNGVVTILSGGCNIALAVILYRNYTKWADANLSCKDIKYTYK